MSTINRTTMLNELRRLEKVTPSMRQPVLNQPLVKNVGVTLLARAPYFADAMAFFRELETKGGVIITENKDAGSYLVTPTEKIHDTSL